MAPKKNGELKPEYVMPFSHKKVWWQCKNGHQYFSSIAAVTKRVNKCLFCNNSIVHKNFNLKVVSPLLAKQWHPKKNGPLQPEEVAPNSSRKVWWICHEGHEWLAAVIQRYRLNSGCPFCSGRTATKENNLAVISPEIARLWHPSRNKPLTPYSVKLKSSWRKYWWKCSKGHEWQSEVYRIKGNSCPYCNGRYATDENNLSSEFPAHARFWHKKKNGDLTPNNVTPHSDREVWWRCRKGHEWENSIKAFTRLKKPFCAECVHLNHTLAKVDPVTAADWNYKRNKGLFPDDVAPNAGKNVWWICKRGHEWKTSIDSKRKVKSCPYCENRKLLPDRSNSLAKTDRALALEWNYDKNGNLTPLDVRANSFSMIVWWICRYGHEWRACIGQRHKRQSGCPRCVQIMRKKNGNIQQLGFRH